MSAGIIILLEQRAYFRISVLLMAWLCLCALSLASARAHYDSSPDSYYQQQLITTLQFSERSSTNLDGSWLFYNQQFIQQPSAVLTAERVHLPASFQQLTGQMEGYGTFIGHFQLPKEFVGRRIAIWMPSQQGAYRVYLNGEPLARVGEAGPDAAAMKTVMVIGLPILLPTVNILPWRFRPPVSRTSGAGWNIQ